MDVSQCDVIVRLLFTFALGLLLAWLDTVSCFGDISWKFSGIYMFITAGKGGVARAEGGGITGML